MEVFNSNLKSLRKKGEQRAVHKSKLNPCSTKAPVATVAELVVMVLDDELVRAEAFKGSASKSTT